jgi:hypothetical protein
MKSELGKGPGGRTNYLPIILPILITGFLTFAGNQMLKSYESKMTAAQLISNREQAESSLRANMFSTLIGPIVGKDADPDKITPEHEVLLAELLTLNFSENFEFKPLLRHIDSTISDLIEENIKSGNKERNKKLEREQRYLLSIANKVRDRQIAMISNGKNGNEKICLERLYFTEPNDISLSNYEKRRNNFYFAFTSYSSVSADIQQLGIGQDICLFSPDHKVVLTISIKKPYWEKRSFLVYVNAVTNHIAQSTGGADSASQLIYTSCSTATKASRETVFDATFMVTPFDFPLTDNTLLADGNRFAITIESVSANAKWVGKPRNVVFKVIWFPKSYFSPRERPIDYVDIRKKLGFKTAE